MSHLLTIFVSVTLLSGILTWLLLYALIPRLQRFMMDKPNGRSSHFCPTPRGGGVAFVMVASASSALAFLFDNSSFSSLTIVIIAPLLALPIAIVGFLDDFHDLSVALRYFLQFLTALLVVLASSNVSTLFKSIPLLLLLSIAVTALINFTNFMDGLDGLVGGCMAAAMAGAAIRLAAPWPIWALVGSLLGFLLWNWSPAQVFMGDVGSTFLGAVFAVLVLQAPTWSEALALLLVATPLLSDACLCVLRRLMAGQQVFQAHRLHLYQRLHQAGWPHEHVSRLYIAATAVLAVALVWGGLLWVVIFASVVLLIGLWLDQQVAVSFDLASRF
jgi:Fuc2NAc and GlcNAc transferase